MENNQVNMKHVRKWAEGKDSLIVLIALMISAFANEYYELSESVHEGKRLEGDIPIPSLRTWLKLYRNPKRIGKVLYNAFEIHNPDTRKSKIIINEIARMISGSKEKRSEESNAIIEELKEEAINDFASKIAEEDRKEFLKNLTKPEIIFFIRVLAPCFTLYRTYPIELLKKAKSGDGDDKALDQLIRLDKSAIFEPKISKIIHEAQVLKAQARMSMIKTAFTSQPNAMNMDAIKCQMGGLIVFITEMLKQKLKPSNIRKLYNAIARDLRIDMHDQDLHEMTVPTFAKRINRASSMWKIILNQDKK
jgi:hypothetical protein